MRPKLRQVFRALQKAAAVYAADRNRTRHLVDEAARKAHRDRNVLEEVGEDLGKLFRLLRASATGVYPVVPWRTVVLALAAVLYFVNPFDLAPDFLPLVGYVDDVTVLAAVFGSVRKDLNEFLSWELKHRQVITVPYWSPRAQ